MKKFTKLMLIIAGVLASVGVICMVVAFSMGLTTGHFIKLIQDGRFSFDEGDFHISLGDDVDDEKEDEKIYGDAITGTETADSDMEVYMVKKPCEYIDIEFAAGFLEIYYDDVECIQVKQKNVSKLKVVMSGSTLHIREEKIGVHEVEDRRLTIVIPTDMLLKGMDLELGASQAQIKDVKADYFDIEVGAGQVNVEQLAVENLYIDTGVGQVNVTLPGKEEEYNYKAECGVGVIEIGTSTYKGAGNGAEVTWQGNTKNIEVECGVGEVHINFME